MKNLNRRQWLMSLSASAALLMGLSGVASAAGGEIELLISQSRESRTSAAALRSLLKHPAIKSSREVFTQQERKILGDMGATYLASTLAVRVTDTAAADKLREFARSQGIGVRIETNAIDLKPASEPFEEFQWALHNSGDRQKVELDHMSSRWIPGRAGEDLRLPPSAPGKKIRVAVLDTGADKTHPDLLGRLARNESECKALEKFQACLQEKDRKECEKIWFDPNNPEVDQDHNGYPLDCEGWSLLGGVNAAGILGRPDFGDDEGHGTHVAGIIAANGTNEIGVRGCSDNVEILPVQVLGRAPQEPIKPLSVDLDPKEGKRPSPQGLADIVARGMIYAIRSNAQVINFSMGWPDAHDSQFMRDIIAEAQSRGILIVAAAGNDSTEALLKPCAYPGVVCVAAHGPDGALTHFSNFGSGVDLAGPGLNILSTWPESKRPVRFRDTPGYEFLSGTSQATPYVSCMAAELLSRGNSSNEAYARLISGTRPTQAPLALVQGSPHELEGTDSSQAALRKTPEDKYTLSGNADLQGSLAVSPQPLIIPVTKDKITITWDRQSPTLTLPFTLKNAWLSTGADNVRITAEVVRPSSDAVRPDLASVSGPGFTSPAAAWNTGETRDYVATLQITDSTDPSRSRIPSDIKLRVNVSVGGKINRSFVIRGEILVPVNRGFAAKDALRLKLENAPRGRTSLLPVDENHDAYNRFQDYLLVEYSDKEWTYHLMSQDRTGSPVTSDYAFRGTLKFAAPAKPDQTREQIVARIDTDFDGRSEYVIGLIEDNTNEDTPTPSPMTFYVLDGSFKLLRTITYDSKLAQIPFQVTGIQVQWLKTGNVRMPSWIGFGKDPAKKVSLRDLWENPKQKEEYDIRFYFLGADGKLQALSKYEDTAGTYRIVDLLRPTGEQDRAGSVPVLLARDTGTKMKPSYIYDFARAEVTDGKIVKFERLPLFSQGMSYRNLLDTRVDSVLSLAPAGDQYSGTFWFGNGVPTEQRLSLLGNAASSLGSANFQDFSISALRGDVDAVLWVRAAFSGPNSSSAFSLTNSEIQFHDLLSGQSVRASLERYTFYEDMFTTNMQFPIVLGSLVNPSAAKIPALYTSESARFTKGVKILAPYYGSKGNLVELGAPARLRFQSEKDCRPVDAPVWVGQEEPAYFDYYCRDQIIRIPLQF